jgi:protein-S-isoprenylcysteine O-methyltransferase Ste14
MAHHASHRRPVTRPARRPRGRLTTWWHGPHRTARHPALVAYTLATLTTASWVISTLAPLVH